MTGLQGGEIVTEFCVHVKQKITIEEAGKWEISIVTQWRL